MSFVVKPSQSNNIWFLALVIIVVAVVAQMRRPDFFTTEQRRMPEQTSASRTESRKADLEGAVSGAIGIDKSRRDSVSVILVNPGP